MSGDGSSVEGGHESVLPEGVQRVDFGDENALATQGSPVYGEPTSDGWRRWNPRRSKLAAMFECGISTGLEANDSVLYLGAANGTTVSHVADFAGPTYAVEFSPRPARDLVDVARERKRLFPLLKDAREPDTYAHVVERNLDALVQDVATRGQADVAAANRQFLADDGRLVLAIKARSEDVTDDPSTVFENVLDQLEQSYNVLETERLEPYHDDHLAVIATPDR